MNRLIAIDFDETITDNTPYPITGKIRPEAITYIKRLHNDGYTLALWTCRYGRYLEEALDLLKDSNLLQYFTYINDDGMDRPCRKIVADFYIDDRSTFGEVNWEKIYEYIINKLPIIKE